MKLYIEELQKNAICKKYNILENLSDVINKLRVLFRRDYFKNNTEYKDIKRRYYDEKNGCEKYLTSLDKELKPTMSVNYDAKKKISFSTDISLSKNKTQKYQFCKMEADKRYYTSMLSLLKRSRDKICKDVNDNKKCKDHIDSEIREIERNLNTLEFVNKYLK